MDTSAQSLGIRYYDAEAVVTSDFVNGTVYLGFDSEDLTTLGEETASAHALDHELAQPEFGPQMLTKPVKDVADRVRGVVAHAVAACGVV
ncbi:hypothetical protein ACIRSJ_25990 [Streptomyces virginiae]|uniref:hypothetical protein n=1 Tax=Streptomyces virginiae TaxID=1961 RepID=UPI0037F4D3C2